MLLHSLQYGMYKYVSEANMSIDATGDYIHAVMKLHSLLPAPVMNSRRLLWLLIVVVAD